MHFGSYGYQQGSITHATVPAWKPGWVHGVSQKDGDTKARIILAAKQLATRSNMLHAAYMHNLKRGMRWALVVKLCFSARVGGVRALGHGVLVPLLCWKSRMTAAD